MVDHCLLSNSVKSETFLNLVSPKKKENSSFDCNTMRHNLFEGNIVKKKSIIIFYYHLKVNEIEKTKTNCSLTEVKMNGGHRVCAVIIIKA